MFLFFLTLWTAVCYLGSESVIVDVLKCVGQSSETAGGQAPVDSRVGRRALLPCVAGRPTRTSAGALPSPTTWISIDVCSFKM